MRPEIIDGLGEARDFYSFARALLALCEPFGPVHSFKLVHNPGVARVACFIELESAKQQPALLRALGAKMLNGAACFEIPVSKDFGNPRKVAPLPAAGFDRRGFAGEQLAR